jgi:hypothetical protein
VVRARNLEGPAIADLPYSPSLMLSTCELPPGGV